MFSGIVQGTAKVMDLIQKPGLFSFSIVLPEKYSQNIEIGASIAIDGVCLTVTEYDPSMRSVRFDMMQQTLDITTHSAMKEGDRVNFERSVLFNSENGGHIVSGHIDANVIVHSIQESDNNYNVTYQYPPALDKYLFNKGFVALNGCSLTISDINHEEHLLTVSYIPETLKITTHGEKNVGDRVNLEIDRQTQAIVDTVERYMDARKDS